MKHLLQGRYLTVAVVSGVAATLAAGAFGLPSAVADDPAPIELRAETVDDAPVVPVPLDDAADTTAPDSPADPTPVTAPTATSAPAPSSPDAPAPATHASAPSLISPDPAPAPVVQSRQVDDSPDSPDSPASAGSIDS